MIKKEYIEDLGEIEIQDYIPSPEEIAKMEAFETQAENDIKTWGGKRQGAGRKPSNGNVLKFQIRVSAKEKEFLQYARLHHLNYDDLMQG